MALKEYTYTYEDGHLVMAAEYDIGVDEYENVTAKNLVNSIRCSYDKDGNLTRKVIGKTGQTFYYEYPENGSPVVKFYAQRLDVTVHAKNDSFGRKEFEEIQPGRGCVSRRFAYYDGSVTAEHTAKGKVKSTPTTNLVSCITFADGRTIAYEYDAEERITRVVDSVDGETAYTYDALGQLLTETVNGVVVNTMTYDNYGNIVTKNGVAYTYDSVWKDQLTSYNGTPITYDAQGNPLSYRGNLMEWEKGRQLKKLTKPDGTVITYTYNANGIRTSKTVGSVKHTYVLDGTKILSESIGTLLMYAHYDNEGSICGITYNNTPYYFLKNLQGDVIAITNYTGEVVCRYTYDAWGKVTSITGSLTLIGTENPYRYRSYYYDTETGLYYLQSRYYDPETGRFVNADDVDCLGISGTVISCNSFSYCENNPVNDEDANGTISFNKIKSVISSLLKILVKNVMKNIASLFRMRNGYLEISNSVIAAGIDGTIMLFCAVGAFFAKAAIKIIVREYLLKSSIASKKFIALIINLLNPGIVSGIIAAIGFLFRWSKYKINAMVSDVVQNILDAKTKLLSKVYRIYSAISSIGSFLAFCFDLFDGEPNNYVRLKVKFS